MENPEIIFVLAGLQRETHPEEQRGSNVSHKLRELANSKSSLRFLRQVTRITSSVTNELLRSKYINVFRALSRIHILHFSNLQWVIAYRLLALTRVDDIIGWSDRIDARVVSGERASHEHRQTSCLSSVEFGVAHQLEFPIGPLKGLHFEDWFWHLTKRRHSNSTGGKASKTILYFNCKWVSAVHFFIVCKKGKSAWNTWNAYIVHLDFRYCYNNNSNTIHCFRKPHSSWRKRWLCSQQITLIYNDHVLHMFEEREWSLAAH